MAGLYTHFVIAKKAAYLFGDNGKQILKHSDFYLLGSNSPDLPYPIGDNRWGDLMHYENTGKFVENGINLLKEMSGEAKEKCLSWLAGYVAHRTADVIIHPVVNLIVGEYKGHEEQHQLCEKHQDAFAFHSLNLGETTKAEFISATIKNCADPEGGLDKDIEVFWLKILEKTFPKENTPNISSWFNRYVFVADKFGEEGKWGHVRAMAECSGHAQLLQIDYVGIKRKDYIDNLPSREGLVNFEDVLNRAIKKTTNAITAMFCLLNDEPTEFPLTTNWNLDSGKDETNQYLFWENLYPDIKPKFVNNKPTLGEKSWLQTAIGSVVGLCLILFGSVINSNSYKTNKIAPLKPLIQKVSETVYAHTEFPNKMNNREVHRVIQKYLPKHEGVLKHIRFNRKGKYMFYSVPDSNNNKPVSDDITTPQLEENGIELNTQMEKKQ